VKARTDVEISAPGGLSMVLCSALPSRRAGALTLGTENLSPQSKMTSTLDTAPCQGNFSYVHNDVRQLRLDKGLTQAELGAHLEVSRQTINAIETDRYHPSLDLAINLARFFGLTVEEVFHVEYE